MIVISGRNVNTVYSKAVELVRTKGVLQPSRAGDVLAVLEPVVLETFEPTERVLLDPNRDANPWFHFFESLHMLAGRNDAAFLNRFVKDFGDRFAEEDGVLHGAYGYRWRKHFGFDQLDWVVDSLKKDPLNRQVVIQMWDSQVDTPEAGAWYGGKPKDICCNTQIFPRIVGPYRSLGRENTEVVDSYLDLMVMCRSNDVIWGATGANAVHFAFLQEYLAGRIGCQVGIMRQMTTNLHGYTAVMAKVGEPSEVDPYIPFDSRRGEVFSDCNSIPIGTDWEHWDEDLQTFMRAVEPGSESTHDYHNMWFFKVVVPMWNAHAYWKHGNQYQIAMDYANSIQAPDWRIAAQQWLRRRIDKRAKVVEEVRAG